MCRMLGVSPSGYYAWRTEPVSARARSDAELTDKIAEIHSGSHGTYGSPRVHAELRLEHGIRCARKRVARLMRGAGLEGVHRRRRVVTTRAREGAEVAPDLVERNFRAKAPDRLWVADMTYLPTLDGWLFLAAVVDVFTRRVVGWAMEPRMTAQLVLSALEMAMWNRQRPVGVIHHSDHGAQYTSLAFGRRLREAGLQASMGSVGDAYDNAMAESFFATLECELIDRSLWQTREQARQAVFRFIEGFYNPRRRHSGLGYLSPAQFEQHWLDAAQ
jgi:putative transposase